ncbi:GNAT family N-acetyltransferase [Streptomyces triticirhizae]|uniref:GNAT family N-acetyltransferase n=1 Tax=Streptomyces triticirhizae TaxID=2483353 RepID=A0A3M2M5P4_9ACTN|nr:GNAT family N-acetyltransferase [Streptomyces triticirhizae]RMI45007.1 GNAT family N-acetyltransferase [Streptomyces triticirhizae]
MTAHRVSIASGAQSAHGAHGASGAHGVAGVAIRRLGVADFDEVVPELARLLVELVAGSVSLGFLRPLEPAAAERWWRGRRAAVAEGELTVWVAAEGGTVLGTVGLSRAPMPAGRHRAEVVKLMVRPDAQGRGLGRALLATAERAARAAGLRLLLLDTEAGTPAERLYRATGWSHYGTVPEYAAESGGVLRDCAFFYKPLDEAPPDAAVDSRPPSRSGR